MSRFDHIICYEDRDEIATSRWLLEGVSTKTPGNTARGWLWMSTSLAGATVTVSVYKDPACASGDKVASGSASISLLPAKVSLAQANSSGITGELYVEAYAEDAAAVPVLVSLCVDGDLTEEWAGITGLPSEVYDAAEGMARHCAAATRRVLLMASQLYGEELGGYGAGEGRNIPGASRSVPDYRRLAAPRQLADAAACWALELALGSCHQMATQTLYSQLRDHFERKRKEAVAGWLLAINIDPDSDADADRSKTTGMVRVQRI